MIYDYFDTVVSLTLALGVAGMAAYALADKVWSELLNLAAVACITFGMGLFFLNSYPVWADRLNNISMYGSRGTLVPVIALLVLMVAATAFPARSITLSSVKVPIMSFRVSWLSDSLFEHAGSTQDAARRAATGRYMEVVSTITPLPR